ncbi:MULTISPECIES: PLP-dependent aminotransferase family protein [unclassified Actinobaculum]|uniref:aminotransferase-like domain-containing protein n=1 Tax=unclassified Actinobaculum TaxID=2609299 RepID=UPI000D529B62|nr:MULTISPECIES: PLP-dependent aminotransferase family protein [unclassified Actinobaculum]AWE43328.1 GntR family transcriptional regulator [Actinobaculum sp. 313]RTE49773.1 PLP-dependent aminotransferase family protein [Actinobaculum sp. 352]
MSTTGQTNTQNHAGESRAAAAGTRLDPWYNAYADRALGMKQSEVRSLFAVANRPEVVSLAGGMPNIVGLPLDFLADMSARIIRERGTKLLQYSGGQGEEELREMIADVMRPDGVRGHPDDITVTTGSQQALDLISEIFLNPGDVVLAEAPSYVGALGTFRAYQANIVHVAIDENGLIPEALEETMRELEAQGKPMKFLYVIPNFHNPAGVCLSAERRPQIVDICRRHHVLIVEDNPYGLLGFAGDPLPALYSYNPDGVVYLGTFSKTFAPGYRVGWALAPTAVTSRLVLANENAVLCPSTFSQLSIAEYLRTYDWYQQVKEYREMYHERGQAMQRALSTHLPMCSWTEPEGGFYTWVKLPEGLDAQAMLPRAVKNLVAYVSGTAFYANGEGHDHMRLSFCYPTPEQIEEGVRRLALVIEGERELVDMFGIQGRREQQGA